MSVCFVLICIGAFIVGLHLIYQFRVLFWHDRNYKFPVSSAYILNACIENHPKTIIKYYKFSKRDINKHFHT